MHFAEPDAGGFVVVYGLHEAVEEERRGGAPQDNNNTGTVTGPEATRGIFINLPFTSSNARKLSLHILIWVQF